MYSLYTQSMITLIHGEDIAASRNHYWQLRQKIADGQILDGATISLTDLQQNLAGEDLFGTKQSVFLENLLSKRKSVKEMEYFTDVINNTNADVVMWESKELTPKQTVLLKNATVRVFKIPATIFALLDNLKPGNGKVLIESYHKTLAEKDPEFVLVMLQRQTRILLALAEPSQESISEISRLAPWQKGKIEKQAKLFSVGQLLHLHDQLFQLELGMKTGSLSLPLSDSLDLTLLSV